MPSSLKQNRSQLHHRRHDTIFAFFFSFVHIFFLFIYLFLYCMISQNQINIIINIIEINQKLSVVYSLTRHINKNGLFGSSNELCFPLFSHSSQPISTPNPVILRPKFPSLLFRFPHHYKPISLSKLCLSFRSQLGHLEIDRKINTV